jgi:uncharacterized protein
MAANIPLILQTILEDYRLPWDGDHGVAHWARVMENGLRLAEETGANVEVVRLFAVLHDSRRRSECTDPNHGPRAAEYLCTLQGSLFELSKPDLRILHAACAGHTHERTHPDLTVQTCWDADRLDLGRVGILPDPHYLCTEAAKRPEMIEWADGRGSFHLVPDLVSDVWGIDLAAARQRPGRPKF